MSRTTVAPLLRFALRLDAVASAATGILLCTFAGTLAERFALPHALLLGAGLFCIPYAALIAAMSRRSTLPRWSVWAIVVGNAVWASECLLIAFGSSFAPTAWGVAFLVGQAAAVFTFAELQYMGLRRGSAATREVVHA